MKKSNPQKKEWLQNQLTARIIFLRYLIDSDATSISPMPSKLAHVRLLDIKDRGIERIGSTSSFVKTHPIYGDKVSKIQELLSELNEPKSGKNNNKVTKDNKTLRATRDAQKAAFVKCADQIASLTLKLERVSADYRIALQNIQTLERDLSEARAITKVLKMADKLIANTVHVDFSKGRGK